MKSPNESHELEDFDPYLGIAVADSWWILGRWLNRLRAAKTDAARVIVLRNWAQKAWDDASESSTVRTQGVVTPEALEKFASTVLRLLEAKFRGRPIADEVRALIRVHDDVIRDEGKYLDFTESVQTFWAVEYSMLFSELDKDVYDGVGWLKAVDLCENENCRRFFIKQRMDNRFDTESCRTNRANRESYKKRRVARSHT